MNKIVICTIADKRMRSVLTLKGTVILTKY